MNRINFNFLTKLLHNHSSLNLNSSSSAKTSCNSSSSSSQHLGSIGKKEMNIMNQENHTSTRKEKEEAEEHNKTKTGADQKFEALQSQLQSRLSTIHAERDKLKQRDENLRKRRQAIFDITDVKEENKATKRQKTNDGNDSTSITDQVKLNVGGCKMVLMRETLISAKDSRLYFLFNGKMDDKLICDEDGHVFMDLDPYYFKKVIEYLYLLGFEYRYFFGSLDELRLKAMIDAEQDDILRIYLDFFGLLSTNNTSNEHRNNTDMITKGNNDNANENNEFILEGNQEKLLKSFESTVAKEHKELSLKNSELDELEEKLKFDENFVKFFTTPPKVSTKDAPLNLSLLDGEMITVKSSIFQESILGTKLMDSQWVEKHTVKCSDSRSAILVEYPPSAFKWIVNQLRLRAVMSSDVEICELDDILKEHVTSMLFPDNEEIILGKKAFNSDILTSWYHDSCITKWLKEANAGSQPKLLFRASINGWSVNDFHSHCDEKGPTLTIIKTSEGYIFGGYNDQSWYSDSYSGYQSSNENDAFLFSIESYNKMLPQKMNVKAERNSDAVYSSSERGPCFGAEIKARRPHYPGNKSSTYDLYVGNGNDSLKHGYTCPGHTFKLPPGTSNFFLTGKGRFEVIELEVFKV